MCITVGVARALPTGRRNETYGAKMIKQTLIPQGWQLPNRRCSQSFRQAGAAKPTV
ncbi:MAG: hypothetical protein LBN74_05245 [Prevotella sp.]|nr:hypothetical protein [Prevotella sp.]